jgi:hypothetical protein
MSTPESSIGARNGVNGQVGGAVVRWGRHGCCTSLLYHSGPPLVGACRAPSVGTRRRPLAWCWTKGNIASERVALGGR